MDQGAIELDITDPNQWKDANNVVYENTRVVTRRHTERSIQNDEDSYYETLQMGDICKSKFETGIQDKNLKRLKCMIYIITVLIVILYIILISVVTILFVPKDPVYGHWTDWSSWTPCDVTCGNGTHIRIRRCTNPVPEDKGNDCIGETFQSSKCSNEICSDDGRWTAWSGWTSCDVTCGKGTRLRLRTCTNPVPVNNGTNCIGDTLQTTACSKGSCQVDGQWTPWSSWTSCDVTCGNGMKLRTRRCTNPAPENKGRDCIGESLQSSQCSSGNCAIDGQWTPWSSWTSCEVTCSKGRKLRTRRCTNPAPENKVRDCVGDSLQSSQCSSGNCTRIMSAFSVTSPRNYTSINGINKLTFSKTIYQYGNDINIYSGTYTCRRPGVYHFSVTLVKKRASSRVDWVYCYLYKNRQRLIFVKVDPTDDDTDNGSAAISQSIVIDLDIGDTVYLSGCNGSPSTFMESWSSFTGFLLYHNN